MTVSQLRGKPTSCRLRHSWDIKKGLRGVSLAYLGMPGVVTLPSSATLLHFWMFPLFAISAAFEALASSANMDSGRCLAYLVLCGLDPLRASQYK